MQIKNCTLFFLNFSHFYSQYAFIKFTHIKYIIYIHGVLPRSLSLNSRNYESIPILLVCTSYKISKFVIAQGLPYLRHHCTYRLNKNVFVNHDGAESSMLEILYHYLFVLLYIYTANSSYVFYQSNWKENRD